MAHTYSIVKSWVDQGRPGVHCGYVKITLADNYDSGFAIDAGDVNPNISTLYQLTVLNPDAVLVDGTTPVTLGWDYDNQKFVAVDWTTAADAVTNPVEMTDVDSLDDVVLYCYYEGS